MPPAGFEPTVLANKRTQAQALDCAGTGIGCLDVVLEKLDRNRSLDSHEALSSLYIIYEHKTTTSLSEN
jgi:hypothetical protein